MAGKAHKTKRRKRAGGKKPVRSAVLKQVDLAHFVQLALDMGADAAKIIDASTIKCAAWVRLKCQYGCPGYRKRLMCPPFTPTPQETSEVVSCYKRAVLLHAHDNDVVNEIIPRLEQKIFLAGYYKALGFGSGPCRICENRGLKCDTRRPCRYPVIARPAMEACGMNVFETVRSNGFHLEVVRSHKQIDDYYGVVLID